MRNLKKALTMLLSLVMVLSLTVPAGALSFTDSSSIEYIDEATLLTQLDIFTGYNDGTFKPQANVSRGEMAIVLTRMMLGDQVSMIEDFSLTAPKLTDVAGTWAEDYIGYCYSKGYIKGYPGNVFKPNNTVAVVEAATMVLRALGWSQNGEFTKNWNPVDIMTTAYEAGLLKDLPVSAYDLMTRDEVVKMVYNALSAQIKKYSDVLGYSNAGTLGHTVYGLDVATGVITDIEENAVYLDNVKYEGVTTDFTNIGMTGSLYVEYKRVTTSNSFTTQNTIDKNHVLGIYSDTVDIVNQPLAVSTDGTSLAALTTKTSDKFVASLDTNVSYYVNGVKQTSIGTILKSDIVKLIDNDKNGKIDVVSVYQYTSGIVSYYNADTKALTIGGRSYTFDEVVGADSLKKDDVVYFYTYDGTIYPTVAQKISGTVTAYDSETNTYTVDNRQVSISARAYGIPTLNVGSTYDVYVDQNNYVVSTNTQATNLTYLYGVANNAYDVNSKLTAAEVTFADGKTQAITIASIDTGASNYRIPANTINGKVYAYTVDKAGNYVLTTMQAGDGWTSFSSGSITNNAISATLGSSVVVDNATLFVDVISGSTYVGYNSVPTMTGVSGWVLVKSGTASVVFITNSSSSVSVTDFVVLSKNYKQTSDNVSAYIYTVLADGKQTELKVNNVVHNMIQANGTGLYTVSTSANGLVTAATKTEAALNWKTVTLDRNGLLFTDAQYRTSANTAFVVFDMANDKVTACTSYSHALGLIAANDLVGATVIVVPSASNAQEAAAVYVFHGYSMPSTELDINSENVVLYDQNSNTIYGGDSAVTVTFTGAPGVKVEYNEEIKAISETGSVSFTVEADADETSFEIPTGYKVSYGTLNKVVPGNAVTYTCVSEVKVDGDLAANTTVTSNLLTVSGKKYVTAESEITVQIVVSGTESEGTYNDGTMDGITGVSVNGSEIFFDAENTQVSDGEFTATIATTVTAEAAGSLTTITVARTNTPAE